jgi:hypothetical protein
MENMSRGPTFGDFVTIRTEASMQDVTVAITTEYKSTDSPHPQSTDIGRDETGSVYLPTQLERTLQLYW